MTPDRYTTTADPLRAMVCFYCRGHFVGTTDKNGRYFHGDYVELCDNCLREAANA